MVLQNLEPMPNSFFLYEAVQKTHYSYRSYFLQKSFIFSYILNVY